MTPAGELLLTLLLLHVIEGVFWVQRSASVFARTIRGRFRRDHLDGPLGNATHTFYVLSPLLPLREAFIVEPLPVTRGSGGFWACGLSGAEDSEPRLWRLDELAGAAADAKVVRARDGTVATTSSAALALAIASRISDPTTFAAWCERRLDAMALRARVAELDRAADALSWVANLLPIALFGGVYLVFFESDVPAAPILGLLAALLIAIWLMMARAHRRLYPALRGDRWMKMAMMIFSFPAAARARAWLARDLLAEFDPLAAAIVLLPRAAASAQAAEILRDLEHPRRVDPVAAADDLAAARRLHLQSVRALLSAEGFDLTAMTAPPERSSSTVQAYCPRCHAEYVEAEGACADCPAVPRRPFPATATRGSSGF